MRLVAYHYAQLSVHTRNYDAHILTLTCLGLYVVRNKHTVNLIWRRQQQARFKQPGHRCYAAPHAQRVRSVACQAAETKAVLFDCDGALAFSVLRAHPTGLGLPPSPSTLALRAFFYALTLSA